MAVQFDPQPVPVNMYEADAALVLVAALPGVMADDVDVTVDDTSAHIYAEMRTPAPKKYLLHEWHYGPYDRRVDIPAGFGGQAEGSFGNGQLALRIERGEGGGTRKAKVVQAH